MKNRIPIKQSSFEGAGDVVAYLVHKMVPHIKHCTGCEKRRKMLNSVFPFRGFVKKHLERGEFS